MPKIRITKHQVKKAHDAYNKALDEDVEFKEFEADQEREFQEALEQEKKERKEDKK